MLIDEAKKIFDGDVTTISPKILREAAKIILSELESVEKTIFELEKKFFSDSADLPGEVWRNIAGYEGFYQVSNKGRVKSLKWAGGKIMKLSEVGGGYLGTNFYNHSLHAVRVHQLVAEAFIPNSENKPCVNHIDGNKKNNCVENLEWATYSENILHAHRNDLIKAKKGSEVYNAKLTDEQVNYIRENYKPYDKNFGGRALAKKFSVTPTTISLVVRNLHYKEKANLRD